MANQDFLITFSVDGTQALRMMDQIGQKAVALEARLNALGRGTGGGTSGGNLVKGLQAQTQAVNDLHAAATAAGKGSILQGLGLAPAQVAASAQQVGGLSRQVASLQAGISARQALGLPVSAGQFATAAVATQRLAQNLGTATAAGRAFAAQAQDLANQSKNAAQQLDQTSQAFGRHTRRIFEAILIYEAFGRAVQAVQAGIDLIIDIDRESRRLEAVLEIGPGQSAEFVRGLGEIASETVTPIHNLVAEADRASAAFLDIEDPAQRAAGALTLMENAGKFTTVTQRDMGVEVTNLIAIMKQFGFESDEMGDRLGQIVTAGGNSSTIIAGLADALQISGRAAQQAGVNFETLLGLESEFLIQTGRTGSEVGNLFKLLFQRLSDPDVAKNVSDITQGLLQMRDAAGNIRDPIQIMLELNALFEAGQISATQFRDVLESFAPPLNPAAKADFILINEILGEIGPRVREIGAADVSALDELVNKINDALGPQFQKLVIDAQLAFVELFGPDLLEGGQDFIDVIRGIGDALATVPPETLKLIVEFTTLLLALKGLQFVISGVVGLLGIRGLAGAFAAGAAQATTMAASMTGAAGATTLLGRAALATTALVGGLLTVMAPLLVAVAAYMALDLAGFIGEQQEALKNQIGESLVGKSVDELLAFRQRLIDQLSAQGKVDVGAASGVDAALAGGLPDIKEFTTDPAIKEGLAEIDRLLAEMGTNGTVSAEDLAEGFRSAGESSSELEDALRDQSSALDQALADAQEYVNSITSMTEADRIAAESAKLLDSLLDEQADALLRLNERYKEGQLTQAQWAQGQNQVNQAADLSARLVAAVGDQLRTMIPELAGAAAGNEALAAALFNVLIHSTNNLPIVAANVELITRLAATSGGAAVATDALAAAQARLAYFLRIAAEETSAFALNNIRMLKAQIAALQATASTGSNVAAQIAKAIAQIAAAIRSGGSFTFGTGGGGGGSSSSFKTPAPQVPILDIGDLSAAQIAALIQMATALRNAIPGETAASKDDIVTLIQDGKFLQNVTGIDSRLLQIALEELTSQMEEANKLANAELQREAMLSNLVVNAGPLSALVSQPTLFGVGGSLASGTGLNFNPTQGNFTINVPVELQGLNPAQLQEMIYNIINQAIRDALRV